eukprot:CAMPEP_0184746748 /NCGR_PEP_ID=MMETSP0315-20130426/9278_1 /TAXON_ID=101924 /ORGANISM="Rhodosorus marinus, Strain UTEX LB 2760" /LENGTH=269 /DNA_ID=CAMNT_0027219471 /DNA_START=52 /DNA_END=861 /DNA_ORIENTATION=-
MSSKNLCEIAREILLTSDPDLKASRTINTVEDWTSRRIPEIGVCKVPDKPAEPLGVQLVDPWKVPKRGKGGTEATRISSLHSLCHIEQVAVNLAWDIVARFADQDLPRAFYDEWVRVAGEEAKHYKILSERLQELDSKYGSLPAHNRLWESATETADSLEARLAIVHMVHEARGLDIHPKTVDRFRSSGDLRSVSLLEDVIYPDEITHVQAGVRWFKHLYKDSSEEEVICRFHEIVGERFRGNLKEPFNHEARAKAGFTKNWYEPLSKD